MKTPSIRREDIRRAERMTYERFDNENWMVTPKFSEVPATSFLDVRKLSTLDEELEKDDETIDLASVIKQAVKRFE